MVSAIDEVALNWGVKVLCYEIKDLTPPAVIPQAMQQQITAEREKRAVVVASKCRKLEQINLATSAREAAIAQSEGEKQAEINKAEGQAAATQVEGGMNAVNLQVAEKYVETFAQNNTLIVPGNMGDMGSAIARAHLLAYAEPTGPTTSSAGRPTGPRLSLAAPFGFHPTIRPRSIARCLSPMQPSRRHPQRDPRADRRTGDRRTLSVACRTLGSRRLRTIYMH